MSGAALRRIALCGLLPWSAVCNAGALHYCDAPAPISADQKDKLLRFGAVIKTELEKSGQGLALIARSGLDLSRFGMRYSHAGFSLKDSQNAPWSVRQLYYACDERKPRIFDQGISGFLLGTSDPSIGYVSVVLLPPTETAALERAALDNRQALQLLGASYSANAYAYGLQYQNCNQWVVELMAAAWGELDGADNLRSEAQRWLKERSYVPSSFEVGSRVMMWLGGLIPWLHSDDHPPEDLDQQRYRVSMPASIEAFVQSTVPGATRIEFCHTDKVVVVRHGWELIPEGCVAGEQDEVIALD